MWHQVFFRCCFWCASKWIVFISVSLFIRVYLWVTQACTVQCGGYLIDLLSLFHYIYWSCNVCNVSTLCISCHMEFNAWKMNGCSYHKYYWLKILLSVRQSESQVLETSKLFFFIYLASLWYIQGINYFFFTSTAALFSS